MKKFSFLLLFFNIFVFNAQSIGDTIKVKAFNYNSTTRDTVIAIPNNPNLTLEKYC